MSGHGASVNRGQMDGGGWGWDLNSGICVCW